MLDNYISRGNQHNVCSIEDLRCDPQEELLLSHRNDTILEEEEEFFELYITPYSQKEQSHSKVRESSVNEDTIIKGNTHREELLSNQCQNYQAEIHRLKKIIIKKNAVIGELTEELRIYYQTPHKSKGMPQQGECSSQQCKKQRSFLQENNLQLYQEIQAHRQKSQQLSTQLTKIHQEYATFSTKLQKLQRENGMLRQQNSELLKSTKKYLSEGSKEIQIISKMREVLAQKLSLKDINIPLPEYQPKAKAGRVSQERRTELKRPNNERGNRPKTLQRGEKENRGKQRSYSYEGRKQ